MKNLKDCRVFRKFRIGSLVSIWFYSRILETFPRGGEIPLIKFLSNFNFVEKKYFVWVRDSGIFLSFFLSFKQLNFTILAIIYFQSILPNDYFPRTIKYDTCPSNAKDRKSIISESKSWIHGGGNRIEPGSSSSAHEDGNRIATGWMHGRLHSIDSRFSFSLFDGSSNDASNVFEDRRTHPPNLGRGNARDKSVFPICLPRRRFLLKSSSFEKYLQVDFCLSSLSKKKESIE